MLDLEHIARAIDAAVAPVTADEARARAGARTHFHRTAVLVSACAVLLAAGVVVAVLVALGFGRHSTSVLVRGNETTTTVATSTSVEQSAQVPLGTPVGKIVISKIGVDWIFVQGSRPVDERKGPMHYPGSPMPGEDGNVVITGHRTTYGAPFFHLNELKPGDVIRITTLSGGFTYIVDHDPFVVAPEGQLSFLDLLGCRRGTRSLTLITNAPKYSKAQRLVVTAHIGSEPVRSCAP